MPADKKFERSEKSFDSLDDCINYIQEHFPEGSKVNVTAIDPDTGERFETTMPAFFYRGEASDWATTVSTMQRLKDEDGLSKKSKEKFESIVQRIDGALQRFSTLSPLESAAYLQHYGLPTALLDITSSISVAAYFASCGTIGDTGLFCIFNSQDVCSQSKVVELTNHPFAERPRRQSAYTFYHKKFKDLKAPECISVLRLKWYSFRLRETDKVKYSVSNEMLDAYSDKVAGAIQLIADDFEKLDDETARWLSKKVAPTLFIGKVLNYSSDQPGKPSVIELISMKEAGIVFWEDAERGNNYQKWSVNYPETRKHKL